MEYRDRKSGILLHPTSLPGKFGIGTLGIEAYQFVDFLQQAKFQIWQMLPINVTGFGNSPYQCFSTIAGNPLMIDLETLHQDGFLSDDDIVKHQSLFTESSQVDFDLIEKYKIPLLRSAYNVFRLTSALFEDFGGFCSYHAQWLDDYALFMAIKEYHGGKSVQEWNIELRTRNSQAIHEIYGKLINEVSFQKFLQYIFFRQWMKVKRYANERGIEIMGDIPIYVSTDSADVWANPQFFEVTQELVPTKVAGVPPDYFSQTGQLWGNPVYKWHALRNDNYDWWRKRFKGAFAIFDRVRIDHFRGFSQFWSIPYGETTAINGSWETAFGEELFLSLKHYFGDLKIVAEDLGLITEDVENLLKKCGFPGMKILQFAFDSSECNCYLPHTFDKNCVVYTGTHDNNTTLGWIHEASEKDVSKAMDYMNCTPTTFVPALIRLALASVADIAIIPMQDILELDATARMNIPGTIGDNWKWKMTDAELKSVKVEEYALMNQLYNR